LGGGEKTTSIRKKWVETLKWRVRALKVRVELFGPNSARVAERVGFRRGAKKGKKKRSGYLRTSG